MRIDNLSTRPGDIGRIPSASVGGTAQTASLANTSSYVQTAQTASFVTASNVSGIVAAAYTASYIVTAQTASFVTGSNVSGIVSSSYTSSYSHTASYVKTAQTASVATSRNPSGLFWTSFLTNPSVAGGSVLGSAYYENNDAGIRLTTAGAIGSTGNIVWNLTGSNAFDFTQDFRAAFNTFYGATAGALDSGDGFIFNFGGSNTGVQTFGIAGALGFRVETYRVGSGSLAYVNGTQIGFNPAFTMGVGNISSAWNTWIIETRTIPVTGKRIATLYWNNETWPQVSVDITSWTPTGKAVVVGAWTGGATANQWCKTAKLEYI